MTEAIRERAGSIGATEGLVAAVWRHQLLRAEALRTGQGQGVQVVYPGRDGPGAGPDFRGALVALVGDGLREGDVEVHLRPADWYAHGHHRDPAYNGVILHVALEDAGLPTVRTAAGHDVPTLPVGSALAVSLEYLLLEGPPASPPGEPCAGCLSGLKAEDVGQALDRAGEARFEAKVCRFVAAIACAGPGQALYEGVLTALGYADNAGALAEVARRAPLRILEGFMHGRPRGQRILTAEALLLGVAGLLAFQRRLALVGEDAAFAARLEAVWRAQGPRDSGTTVPLHLFRVRPENQPARRLAAAAHLVDHHSPQGLAESLRAAALRPELPQAIAALDEALRVPAEGYFATRYDLGRPLEGRPALVGPERAAVVLVNAALPFLAAWGQMAPDRSLEERARELFRRYPGREDNRILRRMSSRWGAVGVPLTTARRQQGLLHLAKGGCCGRCMSSAISLGPPFLRQA